MSIVSDTKSLSVSVVMCTYNGAKFIEQQLETILQQTYPLKEILIYDDASTDNTVAILEKFAAVYPIIKLQINFKNIGYTRNFEQALLSATGDAIAISDQDDVWDIRKIEKMIKAWKPGIPLIYCNSRRFTKEVPVNPKNDPLFRNFEGKDARKIFLFNTVSGHNILFRREFLSLVLPFSEKVTYDWWMAVVAAYNGGVQYLPEILVFQRAHENNITIPARDEFMTKQQIQERFKSTVARSTIEFAKAPNMPEKHRKIALRLSELLIKSTHYAFYKPLFYFLLRYRKPFFNHKKRKISFFSEIKHSFRKTKNE